MSGYDDHDPPQDPGDATGGPTGDPTGDATGRTGRREDVGSVAEEAAKLFGAFADVARQHGGDTAGTVAGLVGQAADFAREVNGHVATDAAECRYCPVCRVVHVVRETSPEVRAHLVTAASSLLQAAAGLLETLPPPPAGTESGVAGTGQRGPSVERIDLEDQDDPTAPPSRGPEGSASEEEW